MSSDPSVAPSTAPERIARRVRRDGPLMAIDFGIVLLVYLTALALRFEGSVPNVYWGRFWGFIPVAVVVHLAVNYAFGLYGRMWQYASVHEARQMALAGITSGALILFITLLGGRLRLIPLSVTVSGTAMALIGFAAVRFQSRLFALRRRTGFEESSRVLIMGAGEAAAKLIKDIHSHPTLGLDPVALVDDDPKKLGLNLHGIRVLGSREAIPALVEDLPADQVLLAIPSATSDVVRDVASICEKADVVLKVLPSVHEIVGGRVTARDIRDLRIEDLLGRQQVDVDVGSLAHMISGRRVLVTGAGGSIGAEIARQVSPLGPAHLLLLDNDETHLHDVATDLPQSQTLLADIRDRSRIGKLLSVHRPEVVFHAAAHKHVPILEQHPEEAFWTNVVGTINIADAALDSGVDRFVFISTDKAVKPISVMGASKRIAEQVVWARLGGKCTFCAVRFGNVLGSRGSVIPTFFRQIAHGGPVTVTDPQMTRYFMSLQEAVQLVLQAAALARGGEVFTLDMGEPVNILELARRVIRLSGRVPHRDVKIDIVGPRPGEKLYEDISDELEDAMPSEHPSIVVSRPPPPDRGALDALLQKLTELAERGHTEELRDLTRRAVLFDAGLTVLALDDVLESDRATAWNRSNT